MFHYSLNWMDNGVGEISIWSFAVKHDVWLNNGLLNYCSGITPLELLTRNKADHRHLSRSHVQGCPIFVMDPKLQKDQNIPNQNWRSFLGQFLGFLEQYSSLIADFQHLNHAHISPQYHIVFGYLFETAYSTGENDPIVNAVCNKLFDHKHDWYVLE